MMLDQSASGQSIASTVEDVQSDDAVIERALPLVLQALESWLTDFATGDVDYLEKMQLAFGDSFSAEAALELAQSWKAGDFSALPAIEFLSADALGGAQAAYEADTATIYLSADFFADFFRVYEDDTQTLAGLIAEELGHHIDTLLNGSADSLGDEGAVFSAILGGRSLSDSQLQALQQEEDRAAILLGDRTAQVERNQTSISFVEVTDTAGNFISGRSYGAGAWGDFNGDGLPDLWVNNHFGSGDFAGPVVNFGRTLFVNDGDGTFTDVVNNGSDVFITSELQGDFHGSAWADFDNDGDQDLIQLVGGEGNTSVAGEENTGEDSEPNRLYINDNGVLRDKAVEYGLAYNSAKGQASVWLDYNNDGRLDLFHGSTQRADGLNPTTVFRQDANGTFTDVGSTVLPDTLQGTTVKFGGLGNLATGMGYNLVLPGNPADIIDVSATPFTEITSEVVNRQRLKGAQDFVFADFNNDLLIDVYLPRVGDDRFFLNSSEGLKETDITADDDSLDTRFGAGVVAADFDNDMDVDIFVLRGDQNAQGVPNILYDNQGDGTFVVVANAGGILPANIGIRDNVTTADYDVDGFVDLFITNGTATASRGPQQLFRNQGNSNNWLQIDLEGVVTNRDGIGAKVYVTAGGITQRRDQTGGVHERSQNHQRLHFGLAQNTQVESIEIEWPSGIFQRLENVSVNQVLKITEQSTDAGAPVAVGDAFTTVEGSAIALSSSMLLDNDDLGDTPTAITAVDTTSANNGTITVSVTGSGNTYTYTPAAGFVGIDSFSYAISDADGQTSSATVTVTVTASQADSELLTDGLVLNLNADTGVAASANGTVGSWADQSGLGNDLLVSTGDPKLRTGALNGHSVIEFDGTGDKLSRALDLVGLPAGNAERTIFLLAKYDGTGYGGAAYGDNQKNQTFGAVVDKNGNLTVQGWGGANDFRSTERGTGAGWLLQGIVHDGTTVSHYRDGNLIGSRAHTYNTDVTGGEGLVIGAEIDSNPSIDMDVATFLIYDRALSDSDRQQVESYLQEKYFGTDDPGGPSNPPNNPTDSDAFLFSLRNGTTLNDVAVGSEDIVQFDGSRFDLFFDGSDVGLGGTGINVNAFTMLSDNEILISFDKALSLAGVGAVDDSDIVKFTATSLGEVTAGSFEMYLDGSDVGLTKGGEDIDALTGLPDGSLVISTRGKVKVPDVSAENADLLLFNPTSLGENTSGSWSLYFDGSDVGLGSDTNEYLDGLAINADDKLLLSTAGDFDVAGIAGGNEDVFKFGASSTGANTSGSFDSLFFDGSDFRLANGNIDSLSFATLIL
jgi:hypothetical protein